jgi:hypothetical protein
MSEGRLMTAEVKFLRSIDIRTKGERLKRRRK